MHGGATVALAAMRQGRPSPLEQFRGLRDDHSAPTAARRFCINPDAVLMLCPRSEDGECDTDVQTLGEDGVGAHENLPSTMLKF